MTVRPTLLITGGFGVVGRLLTPALREHYNVLIADRSDCADFPGDLTDPALAREAIEGVDAILHLAANAKPTGSWQDAAANVAMTATVLDAAERRGVRKIVQASSVHASGLNFRDDQYPLDPLGAPRPCCPYGASKVASEALGQIYAQRTGASVISIRLGHVGWPLTERECAATWLSNRDGTSLMLAALHTEVRHGVYYGVSRYASGFFDITNTRAELAYEPRDTLPTGALDLPSGDFAPCLMFEPATPDESQPARAKPAPRALPDR